MMRAVALQTVDSEPALTLEQIKSLKDSFLPSLRQEPLVNSAGNSSRHLANWISTAVEYALLKHESVVITIRVRNAALRISTVAAEWPKEKERIESLFLIQLYSEPQSQLVGLARDCLEAYGHDEFLDF